MSRGRQPDVRTPAEDTQGVRRPALDDPDARDRGHCWSGRQDSNLRRTPFRNAMLTGRDAFKHDSTSADGSLRVSTTEVWIGQRCTLNLARIWHGRRRQWNGLRAQCRQRRSAEEATAGGPRPDSAACADCLPNAIRRDSRVPTVWSTKPPTTFETKADAQAWLAMESAAITERRWKPRLPDREPGEPLTFRQYASSWLEARELKPRTRDEYRKLLGLPRDGAGVIRQPAKSAVTLLDEFGDSTLEAIVPQAVRSWHRGLGAATPTRRAHLYALLRTVLGSAVEDEIIATNPCQIRGAGKAKRVRRIEPATREELRIIVAAVPERWAMLVELAAWCALRFGEATELRRKDVSKDGSVLKVRRGVTWLNGSPVVGEPKSEAGARDVTVPPHLIESLLQHLDTWADPTTNGLVFPAVGNGHLNHGTFHKHYRRARASAGRPDLRLHDLRHTGAVFAAQAGATTRELMDRLGHTTAEMAMRYQHVAEGRQAEIARRLSQLAADGDKRA
jgi:integrase